MKTITAFQYSILITLWLSGCGGGGGSGSNGEAAQGTGIQDQIVTGLTAQDTTKRWDCGGAEYFFWEDGTGRNVSSGVTTDFTWSADEVNTTITAQFGGQSISLTDIVFASSDAFGAFDQGGNQAINCTLESDSAPTVSLQEQLVTGLNSQDLSQKWVCGGAEYFFWEDGTGRQVDNVGANDTEFNWTADEANNSISLSAQTGGVTSSVNNFVFGDAEFTATNGSNTLICALTTNSTPSLTLREQLVTGTQAKDTVNSWGCASSEYFFWEDGKGRNVSAEGIKDFTWVLDEANSSVVATLEGSSTIELSSITFGSNDSFTAFEDDNPTVAVCMLGSAGSVVAIPVTSCANGARYVDNGDGTVLDCNTDITWLKNAHCEALGTANWNVANTNVSTLKDGVCGLTDSSDSGDWRLPTVLEFCSDDENCGISAAANSLMNKGLSQPFVNNAAGNGPWAEYDPFVRVQRNIYWTVDEIQLNPVGGTPPTARAANLSFGRIDSLNKEGGEALFAWPVLSSCPCNLVVAQNYLQTRFGSGELRVIQSGSEAGRQTTIEPIPDSGARMEILVRDSPTSDFQDRVCEITTSGFEFEGFASRSKSNISVRQSEFCVDELVDLMATVRAL